MLAFMSSLLQINLPPVVVFKYNQVTIPGYSPAPEHVISIGLPSDIVNVCPFHMPPPTGVIVKLAISGSTTKPVHACTNHSDIRVIQITCAYRSIEVWY